MGMAYEPPQTPEGEGDNLPEEESIEPRSSRNIAPGTPGGAGRSGKADPGDYSTLPRSYLSVLARPRPETYLAEMPNAGWGKTLLGVALVTLVTFGMKLLLMSNSVEQVNKFKDYLKTQGQEPTLEPWRTVVEWFEAYAGPLPSLVVPLTFFGGSALFYMLARAVRGKGDGMGQGASFMTHSYFLSLSYTPLHIITALVTVSALLPQELLISCLAFVILLGATLYQLYCAGVSMQASQKLTPGKAQMVAFLPWITWTGLLICVGVFAAIAFGRALVGQ
jgi:hypothetical protein